MHRNLGKTISLCPECLKKIEAAIIEKDGSVYMRKSCPEHGLYEVLIWEDSGRNYLEWIHNGGLPKDEQTNIHLKSVKNGCPFDCGICSRHAANITTAALMTTNVCDVDCPICFTKDKEQGLYMPTLDKLLDIARSYKEAYSAEHLIELCGGEPTVREDLPELTSGLREMGFDHIQLNTNGIRIARDPEFLIRLKNSGVTVVYMGFDGVEEKIYRRKYGRELFKTKMQAIKNCSEAKIAVVLVPVVIKGVNDGQLGSIFQVARECMPAVKGVYFQPVSFFGQYSGIPKNEDRITIPRILRLLEEQTDGVVSRKHFNSGGSEHPLCSFSAFYITDRKRMLKPVTKYKPRGVTENSVSKVIQFNKKAWSWSENRTLTVGGMHFQDVWNIDLERLRQCRVCILNEDKNIIPLCAKYVTSSKGKKIYSKIS